MIDETWRPVADLPGYEISDRGRLKSPRRGILRGYTVYRAGRARCVIYCVGRRGCKRSFPAHRLVLLAFVGPCPEGMEGCHADGDGANNALQNLRWDTHKANVADSIRHGTFVRGPGFQRGNRFGRVTA